MTRLSAKTFLLLAAITSFASCRERETASPGEPAANRLSILLVTLDTTRADSIGPAAGEIDTPSFNAIAAKGARFEYAYAPAPETLPSHASMMTGLYPAGHGIHENARYVPDELPLLAEKLHDAGYVTAAFVSGYPLSRQFGLARGFTHYDDQLGAGVERRADRTTARAIDWLQSSSSQPVFLWVHYFDPHYPYEPPSPYDARYVSRPYLGEIAAMDAELGRLIEAFGRHAGEASAFVIAGDHGEGLGDHGEPQHGNLLYQSTMHVPLVVAAPSVPSGTISRPVSIRRVFHTILHLAGGEPAQSLLVNAPEVVMGEAMKPYLNYGWQPQVMAVQGVTKVIQDGTLSVFDVAADPRERQDRSGVAELSRELRAAIREYPVPSIESASGPAAIDEEDRRQLASLGYISSDTRPVIRPDAPRPVEMTELFDDLDRASGLFVAEAYAEAVPVLEAVLEKDPHNLMSALRLAAAHSALGRHERAMEAFRHARRIAPDSTDVDHYLALHYLSRGDWKVAAPILERVVERNPNRLPALEALARVRERQDRADEALRLWQRVESMRSLSADELTTVGALAMRLGRTAGAIGAFERVRAIEGAAFDHDLELGVLYMDAKRYDEAKRALDRIPASHPARPMVLFKRAQVSVLLGEPDSAVWIERAREHADDVTRPLIEREKLFH